MMSSSMSMAQATESVPRKVRHGGPGRRLQRSAVAGEGGMRGIEDRSSADAPQRERDGGRGRDKTHTDRTRREKAGAQQPRMGGGGQMSASEVEKVFDEVELGVGPVCPWRLAAGERRGSRNHFVQLLPASVRSRRVPLARNGRARTSR